MTAATCPFPRTCPVPDPARLDLRMLRTVSVPGQRTHYSVYSIAHDKSLFNDSGAGDTRFSPLFEMGCPVPTLYVANTRTAALLETAFHEVQPTGVAVISRATDLDGKGLRVLDIPADTRVIDLRDNRLYDLGISRSHLVATSAAHYPCTREWAARLRQLARQPRAAGLLWHSRVAEIASRRSPLFADLQQTDYAEVMVLFGDRLGSSSIEATVEFRDLSSPGVADIIESIADELGATIV